ncbi:Ca(2+)-dependent cysteine protease, partial [Borealophlyctis nickersoniae]
MPRRHKHDPEDEEESEEDQLEDSEDEDGEEEDEASEEEDGEEDEEESEDGDEEEDEEEEDETAKWPAKKKKNKPQPPKTQHNPHNAPYPSRPDSGKADFTMRHQPGVGETKDFVLSNCTGTKKALLIGINYSSHESGKLNGCINDVTNIKKFLTEKYNFPEENMVVLTDDREPDLQPTAQNILMAMQWLVKDAQPDDSLFFHFSGHGGHLQDQDGDEDDGWDETICPVDYQTEGQIRDDT